MEKDTIENDSADKNKWIKKALLRWRDGCDVVSVKLFFMWHHCLFCCALWKMTLMNLPLKYRFFSGVKMNIHSTLGNIDRHFSVINFFRRMEVNNAKNIYIIFSTRMWNINFNLSSFAFYLWPSKKKTWWWWHHENNFGIKEITI